MRTKRHRRLPADNPAELSGRGPAAWCDDLAAVVLLVLRRFSQDGPHEGRRRDVCLAEGAMSPPAVLADADQVQAVVRRIEDSGGSFLQLGQIVGLKLEEEHRALEPVAPHLQDRGQARTAPVVGHVVGRQ